jgi:thiamine-monophosphate kinase
LVLSHDTIVEGVHYRVDDPPASVGRKLVAVNASDLAAKGAFPEIAMLSLTMRGDGAWEMAFLEGLSDGLEQAGLSLVGGDTTALPDGAPRVLGLTVIGRAGAVTPHRAGGRPGDTLWVVGTLGDAAAGLALLDANARASGPLVEAYRCPMALGAEGRALARHATAMMDVSDGLLLDAGRLAQASKCAAMVDLGALPLSDAFVALHGEGREARLFAATGGDDYALLLASTASEADLRHCLPAGATITPVGRLAEGAGLSLRFRGEPIPLPERLGYEHRSD